MPLDKPNFDLDNITNLTSFEEKLLKIAYEAGVKIGTEYTENLLKLARPNLGWEEIFVYLQVGF